MVRSFIPSTREFCWRARLRRSAMVAAGFALLMVFADRTTAQVHQMPGASGLLEVGTPPFVVVAPETIGLNSSPTDIHQLPDGRVLVLALPQIAIGDGTHWDVYPQDPREPPVAGVSAAVSAEGRIYLGMRGGFGRVEIGEDGFWRLAFVARWPDSERAERPQLRAVAEFPDQWLWHAGSGSIISWQPTAVAKTAGATSNVQTIFEFKGQTYVSDQTHGHLFRLVDGRAEIVLGEKQISLARMITCAVPLGDTAMLVGTHAEGLQVFDGNSLRPLEVHGALATHLRINDLCATEGGFFAAALENYGIVFFEPNGRVVQVLERSVDHRLARVKRLLPAPGGVLWGLLEEGVVRVAFPGRISHIEPLVATGIITAHPYRIDGRLWVLADGRTLRGMYDEGGRLVRLEPDAPPDTSVLMFTGDLGVPLAGTERGAYFRSEHGWVCFAPDIVNLRVLQPKPIGGRWLYAAAHELGWLSRTANGIEVERIPAPDIPGVYNSVTDSRGRIWLELGSGLVGRVTVDAGRPHVDVFGRDHGVPDGWAQVFEIGGEVGFNIGDQILRFDDATSRFVRDEAFAPTYAGVRDVVGRPGLDARGRLWITADGGVQVLEHTAQGWRNVHEPMPPGFLPYHFTFESSGIVWMHSERRLIRYDPGMPVVPPQPLRAQITRLTLTASNRTRLPNGPELAPLSYGENSFIAHFVATGNPFAGPVVFEVKLEGSDNNWTAAGSGNSAVFNRLKEGRYVLHVRPRTSHAIGEESALAFTILAPWYRSVGAYIAYSVLAAALVLAISRVQSYIQRRENHRLETLVTERTSELNASAERLALQVEKTRILSEAIAQMPVAVLITTAEGNILFVNDRACELTGYTPTELLGENVRRLRSRQNRASLIAAIEQDVTSGRAWRGELLDERKDGNAVPVRSMVVPIRSPDGLIRHHLIVDEDITAARAEQQQRRRLEAELVEAQRLESIGTLAGGIAHDFNNILTAVLGFTELAAQSAGDQREVLDPLGNVTLAARRAKALVSHLLTFSRRSPVQLETLDLAQSVAEALRLVRASTPSTVAIRPSLQPALIRADVTQVQQVVLNLCTNATHAVRSGGTIEVSVYRTDITPAVAAETPELWVGPAVCLSVKDGGCGMAPATLARIFDPFFTTKAPGEGTGLGLSVVRGIVTNHQGAIRVRSRVGEGTHFEIFFQPGVGACATPAHEAPAPHGDGEQIMVVDDEPTVAAFVAQRLQQFGYVVRVFTDPAVALAECIEAPHTFAAIVTDLTMPKLTGASLVKQIRAAGWPMPAVIITGYNGDAVQAEVKAMAQCRVLLKPFSGEEIAHAVAAVLHEPAAPPTTSG